MPLRLRAIVIFADFVVLVAFVAVVVLESLPRRMAVIRERYNRRRAFS